MVNLTIGGGSFKGISYTGALEYLFVNNLVTNKKNISQKEPEKEPEKEQEKEPVKESEKEPEKETEKEPEKEPEKELEKEPEKEPQNEHKKIEYNTSIENFYGSSVGAIIGIFFLIGYTPYEILNILINLNLEEYCDFNISNIDKKFSLISDNLFLKVNDIFSKKENVNITFKEFYNKYNTNVNIFATSLTTRKNVCFNHENYPDYNILQIVQASASIPIIFPPVLINDEYFIDGCVKCIDGVCYNKVLNDKNIHYVIKSDYSNKKIKNFLDYITQILNCTLQNEELLDTKYTININFEDEYNNKFNFSNISQSDKIKLFYIGLYNAQKKLQS